nr:MAG TPA: hypothetical protein [Caudoviricetes sp.]
MATTVDIARSLASSMGARAVSVSPHAAATSTRYGTTQGDAAAGETVRVLMDGSDEEVEVRVDAPVRKGERVKVIKQGGAYTVVALGTMAQTYATKVDVSEAAEGLELKIGKKVDAQGAVDALSTLIKATPQGVQVGKVGEDGNNATAYSVVSSEGAFEVHSVAGVPMAVIDDTSIRKRGHSATTMTPLDTMYTDWPSLVVPGVETLLIDEAGMTTGTRKLSLGGYKLSGYLFLEFVYGDGKRQYTQRLHQPYVCGAASLSRTVSDGTALYTASVTVTVDQGGSLTMSNNVELYVSPAGTTTSDGKLRLYRVFGWA